MLWKSVDNDFYQLGEHLEMFAEKGFVYFNTCMNVIRYKSLG